jgi:hypothetical protein
VVNQLLTNESEKQDGQYFKGYEFSSKEWEKIKVLNAVLSASVMPRASTF